MVRSLRVPEVRGRQVSEVTRRVKVSGERGDFPWFPHPYRKRMTGFEQIVDSLQVQGPVDGSR